VLGKDVVNSVVNSGKSRTLFLLRYYLRCKLRYHGLNLPWRYLCCSIPRNSIHPIKPYARHDRHIFHGTLPGALRHDPTCPRTRVPSTSSQLDVTARLRRNGPLERKSFQRPGRTVRVAQRCHGPQVESISQVTLSSSMQRILDQRHRADRGAECFVTALLRRTRPPRGLASSHRTGRPPGAAQRRDGSRVEGVSQVALPSAFKEILLSE
jgi:hypothetical protein